MVWCQALLPGHRRHNERIHTSGAGGRSCGDGPDGGSRVGPERAGEAEWSEGKEGKTEQNDVQNSVKTRIRAHRHYGGRRFFCL